MIVLKFGGTSVQDAAAIAAVADIVASRRTRRPVVVVSAMASVTDTLLRAAYEARQRRLDEAISDIEALRARHLAEARALLADSSESIEAVHREIKTQFAE